MSDPKEVMLHWAAAVSVVLLGLLAFLPESMRHTPVIGSPWSYLLRAVLGIRLAGFLVAVMLVLCALGVLMLRAPIRRA